MTKLRGLRSRLFLSHLLVVSLSLGFYILLRTIFSASIGWSLVGSLLIGLGMSYELTRRNTHPLMELKRVTQALAAGNLEARLPKSTIPDVNQLNRSFNRMALRLQAVEAKRSEMIGDLAHELRTPLTVIRGYLEEWADERLKPTARSFHQLIREVRRLERLVMDLQLLSKAEMGHLPLQLQSVPVDEILRQIQEIFDSQLPDDGPEFRIEDSLGLVLWADPDRTLQILVNLVGNALRYTNQGCIMVHAKEDTDHIQLIVVDTGPGISEADLPHIFDRFWRSEHSRISHPDGSGLGLAIAKRMTELQGGSLKVSSQLNQGTTFTLSLPQFHPQFEVN